MEQDWSSWFPQPQFDWQSHNLGYLGSALPREQGSNIAPFMDPDANMVSKNGFFTMNPFTGLPNPTVGDLTDSSGWFYCMPRFRQAFTPSISSILNQKVPDDVEETVKGDSGMGARCAQKKFLAFDQSGDQTTLIFSCGIGAPVKCYTSWTPKPMGAYNLNSEDPGVKEHSNLPFNKPIFPEGSAEKNETDLQSEMREDTDEINALLYSEDDSDYEEDDEVTSTDHSPSTMTTHDKHDLLEELMEEVASSDGSFRKRKLFQSSSKDVPSPTDTACLKKHTRISGATGSEDDAESIIGTSLASYKSGNPDCGNKRMRKEKIWETVSILQNIIPGGKSKDPICVFDEAIEYLKCLKHNAEALGLQAL